jgi:hypothetical protein
MSSPVAINKPYAEFLSAYAQTLDADSAARTAQFQRDGFIELEDFVQGELWDAVEAEVHRSLNERAVRREIQVASTDNSPRYYEAVGRNAIFDVCQTIPDLYRSPALLGFLAELAGEPEIVPVPHEPEEIVVTRMTQTGDSHGWHWDDYSYSMIWMIEAPTAEEGGAVEYVRDTEWDKDDPQIAAYLERGPIERRQPLRGSAYLLRADTALHRVAPLVKEGALRIILCFSYASLSDLEREVSHESMQDIYPEDH